jgi:hypothetical protein
MADVERSDYWKEDDLSLSAADAHAPKKDANLKHHVVQLQNDLIALGYLSGHVDGSYGPGTQVIESTGKFERISAQGGWHGSYNKTEWWHFQYKLEEQPTFLDEWNCANS